MHKAWIQVAMNIKHALKDSLFLLLSVHTDISTLRSEPNWPFFQIRSQLWRIVARFWKNLVRNMDDSWKILGQLSQDFWIILARILKESCMIPLYWTILAKSWIDYGRILQASWIVFAGILNNSCKSLQGSWNNPARFLNNSGKNFARILQESWVILARDLAGKCAEIVAETCHNCMKD